MPFFNMNDIILSSSSCSLTFSALQLSSFHSDSVLLISNDLEGFLEPTASTDSPYISDSIIIPTNGIGPCIRIALALTVKMSYDLIGLLLQAVFLCPTFWTMK